MRVVQSEGKRGSLKWLQRAVETCPDLLQPAGLPPIHWLSPRRDDDFAEYRDGAFLDLLDLGALRPALRAFWPARGPQWDALGRAGETRVLVEAKAHVRELLSPPSAAKPASHERIAKSLDRVKTALGADERSDWARVLYQYANRLAHLWFLRDQGVDARLLFVDFVGDEERNGPQSPEAWAATYQVADHALGLTPGHPLARFITHMHPPVAQIASAVPLSPPDPPR